MKSLGATSSLLATFGASEQDTGVKEDGGSEIKYLFTVSCRKVEHSFSAES